VFLTFYLNQRPWFCTFETMKNPLFIIPILFLFSCSTNEKPVIDDKPKSKVWRGVLVLDSEGMIKLPFLFEYDVNDSNTQKITLLNAEERIEVTNVRQEGDSLFIRMDPYDSELQIAFEKKEMKGVWINRTKGDDYIIPFYARNGSKLRFLEPKFEEYDVNGKFQVQFGDSSKGFPALAELKQKGNKVTGTFRTETGDYRYLEGVQSGNRLFLSCFDGSHAFLFTSNVEIDSADNQLNLNNGYFYSGNHYQKKWTGAKNDTFDLMHPDSLTYIKDDTSSFGFQLGMSSGDVLSLEHPNFSNKVSFIQIMGTWCPNCKDETEYLKSVYEKWGADQVYVLAIAFENGNNVEQAQSRLSSYRKNMNIPYDLVYGGTSKKEKVTDIFPALNKIISFPTLIILDKQQQVVKIHTGFNGPATSRYQPFVEEMTALIDSLVTQ